MRRLPSTEQGRNKLGPSLFAIVDRKAGSVAAYAYSAATRQSDFQLDPRQDRRLYRRSATGGVRRQDGYHGLAHVQDRADVIAYLKTLH